MTGVILIHQTTHNACNQSLYLKLYHNYAKLSTRKGPLIPFTICCCSKALLASKPCWSLLRVGPVEFLVLYGYTHTYPCSLAVLHESPGGKHLQQPCLPLNCIVFNTKHFAGKSQVPAKSMILHTNGCGYKGNLTWTPLDSNAESFKIRVFKIICILGFISPNHRPANNVLLLIDKVTH